MGNLQIHSSSTAEKDRYLIDCFHDAGFLKTLIHDDYSILAGRKGAGKTAIARYLEKKFSDYSLFGSSRISITSFTHERQANGPEYIQEKILLFILLKTSKYLFDQKFIITSNRPYWEAVFEQTGLSTSSNFDSFQTTEKKNSLGVSFANLIKGKVEETRTKKHIEINIDSILEALLESMETVDDETGYLIFIDDISDYLDGLNKEDIANDIITIRDILFKLDEFNTLVKDRQKGLRWVACIRDDLFEFMEGSNINKLKTNSLLLSWDEKSFASLLIRRLPHFEGKIEESLDNPISSIKALFPDSIFQSRLKEFDTNRYGTNFYAYMVAISFNRPRDFLAYCYSMRNKLSLKHLVEIENIDSAESEYSDYFMAEIRDELFLASRVFDFKGDTGGIEKLIHLLSKKDGFNSNQLRTDLAGFLDEKTSLGKKKIERFIYELWWYGILGFKEPKQKLINFRYILSTSHFLTDKAGEYNYFLHRGLWWFVRKSKGRHLLPKETEAQAD
jgi:hypothetical protein